MDAIADNILLTTAALCLLPALSLLPGPARKLRAVLLALIPAAAAGLTLAVFDWTCPMQPQLWFYGEWVSAEIDLRMLLNADALSLAILAPACAALPIIAATADRDRVGSTMLAAGTLACALVLTVATSNLLLWAIGLAISAAPLAGLVGSETRTLGERSAFVASASLAGSGVAALLLALAVAWQYAYTLTLPLPISLELGEILPAIREADRTWLALLLSLALLLRLGLPWRHMTARGRAIAGGANLLLIVYSVARLLWPMLILETQTLLPSAGNAFDPIALALRAAGAVLLLVGAVLALRMRSLNPLLKASALATAGLVLLAAMAGVGPAYLASGRIANLHSLSNGIGAAGWLVLTWLLAAGGFALARWYVTRGPRDATTLADLPGLGRTEPGAAFAMSLFALSLAGLPATAGLFGKLFALASLLGQGPWGRLWALAAGAGWAAVAAAWARVPIAIYLGPAEGDLKPAAPRPGAKGQLSRAAITALVMLTLLFGALPHVIIKYEHILTHAAVRAMMPR